MTLDPCLDLSGTKAFCFQGLGWAAHVVTSQAETEHSVLDVGRTEVATGMDEYLAPCLWENPSPDLAPVPCL